MNRSKSHVLSPDAFDKALSVDVLDRITRRLPEGMRERRLGLRGFLWLGLYVAAHAVLPNLETILGQAAAILYGGVKQSIASVSAFCQYRVRFPPQGAALLLA
jgi:hypothetical protein